MMLCRFLHYVANTCSDVTDVCYYFILRMTDFLSFQPPRDQVQAILNTEAVLAYDTLEHSFNMWCRNPKKFREFISIATWLLRLHYSVVLIMYINPLSFLHRVFWIIHAKLDDAITSVVSLIDAVSIKLHIFTTITMFPNTARYRLLWTTSHLPFLLAKVTLSFLSHVGSISLDCKVSRPYNT